MRLRIRIILVVTLQYVVSSNVKSKFFIKKYFRTTGNVIKTVTAPHKGVCALECATYDGCEGFRQTRVEEKFLCHLLDGIQNAECGNISVNAAVDVNKEGVCPQGIVKSPRCPGVFRSYNYQDRGISYNMDNEGTLINHSKQFMLVYEGLNKVPGTVSMESIDKPGWYLTNVYGGLLLQEINNCQTSAFNDTDATFWLRDNVWFNGTVSLEWFASLGHYIRHTNFMMRVHASDGTNLFQKDASFMFVHANEFT